MALGGLHPLGWCALHNIEMAPVPDLIDSLIEESELQNAKVAVEEALNHGVSVPGEAFDGEGYTAVERIKQGMKVEVGWFCGFGFDDGYTPEYSSYLGVFYTVI